MIQCGVRRRGLRRAHKTPQQTRFTAWDGFLGTGYATYLQKSIQIGSTRQSTNYSLELIGNPPMRFTAGSHMSPADEVYCGWRSLKADEVYCEFPRRRGLLRVDVLKHGKNQRIVVCASFGKRIHQVLFISSSDSMWSPPTRFTAGS